MAQKRIEIVIAAKTAIKGAFSALGQSLKNLALAGTAAGAAIGAAMLNAAKRAQEFNKQIGQIATLSKIPISEVKAEVKSLSAEFGIAKDELTEGLYQALSAGVPEDNVFEFLRSASKAGIAGAASTAEAVDILTTTLNAFKIPASQAGEVADVLFTTVKLGKTTLGELSASLAQVAPLAAASGVSIEEIAAATATLTKQGTPTTQAMTQIRSAILAMNETLGDGWADTMTLQEGMQAMSDAAGGSASKIKELTGRVEGSLAILATTGANAKGAAEDLDAMATSAGAANEAFSKMAQTNPLEKLEQSADNIKTTLGQGVLDGLGAELKAIADGLRDMEKSGASQEWARDLAWGLQKIVGLAKGVAKYFGFIQKGAETVIRMAKGENIVEAIGNVKARDRGREEQANLEELRAQRRARNARINQQEAAEQERAANASAKAAEQIAKAQEGQSVNLENLEQIETRAAADAKKSAERLESIDKNLQKAINVGGQA